MSLFDKHKERLERAVEACQTRGCWVPFEESPSRKRHPDGAHEAGRAAFEERLMKRFPIDDLPSEGWTGHEVSPYTNEPLGITYPRVEVEALVDGMMAAVPMWASAGPQTRVGVCMEILDRLSKDCFRNAYATMHTAGQAFMLAFAGSGASSLDRGLEALAMTWAAMKQVPASATYTRRFAGREVTLHKRYHLRPVGLAVVISCGSYPAWNAYPAIFANLAAGNPVVVKPHPGAILPMALAVKIGRAVLVEQGFDPNLLTLAADTWEEPVTKHLLLHPATKIIDFTGGQGFGSWIEQNCRHAQVYTETAGCNAVVLESADDLDAALHAIAHSLVLFSSQMCTAAQNLWLPPTVRDGDREVPADEVEERLVSAVRGLLEHAPALCGALGDARVLEAIASVSGRSILASAPYPHPEFPDARTATPVIVGLEADDRGQAQREHFGPIAFVIRAADRDQALAGAAHDAGQFGAIASYAYSVDPAFQQRIAEVFVEAGASVGINLVRQLPINFTAAFSDYHVTGLNPAGTASLTDPGFVANRFRVVQTKTEVDNADS